MSYNAKCVLSVLILIGIFACLTSPKLRKFFPKAEEPVAAEEVQTIEGKLVPPPTPFLIIPRRPLIVYVEKEPIPQAWLDEWQRQTGEKVEQRLWIPAEGKDLSLNGDVYSISPRYLAALREKLELLPFENNELWNGINPVFGGHAFDSDNKWTLPWRWTPYFFYLRNPAVNPAQPNAAKASSRPEKWWLATNAIFPNDLELLTAQRLKEQGESANIKHDDLWTGVYDDLEKNLSGSRLVDEKACWDALKNNKADLSFLPAALRLKAPAEIQQNFRWQASPRGALIQFDTLVISACSTRLDLAKKFVQFLTAPEQQEKLLADTGYFPVKSHPGQEWKAQLSAPTGDWFARSEFLEVPALPAGRDLNP